MSIKMIVTVDLKIIPQGKEYYVYDSCGDCITKATSINQIKKDIKAILHNALGFDALVTVGKNTIVKTEPLNHEGKQL